MRASQLLFTGEKRSLIRFRPFFAPGESGQRGAHGLQRRQDAAFQPPQRGQAERHQFALRRAQIVTAQGKIGGEIFGAGHEIRADRPVLPFFRLPRGVELQLRAQTIDFIAKRRRIGHDAPQNLGVQA